MTIKVINELLVAILYNSPDQWSPALIYIGGPLL